jgi:predicted lactoylglutathione lyase
MTNETGIRFGMMVLYVRDIPRSLEFYRLLGLDVPDPDRERPVSIFRADGFTLIITVDAVARRFDPAWSRPQGGYQQVMEFLVDDDAAVDDIWGRMTAAGHRGIASPGDLLGPYATMIEDPDGNGVLVSNDPVTNAA